MIKSKRDLVNIFYPVYFIWGLFSQINNTVNIRFNLENTIATLLNIILILTLFFCLLLIVGKHEANISMYKCLYFTLLLVFIVFISKNQTNLSTFLAIFSLILIGGNFNFNKILKIFLIFTGLVLVGVIGLSILNKIPPALLVGQNLRMRSSLGFSYYTYSAQLLFYFTLAYLVYKSSNISYAELICLMLANIYVFYNTNTRNPYILSMIFILYVFLDKILKFKIDLLKFRIFKILFSFIFPICFLILIYITFYLPIGIFEEINEALSGRLSLNVLGFQTWGIHVFGQKIVFNTFTSTGMVSNYYNFVDSSYFQNLLVNGWVFIGIILILWILVCKNAVRHKQTYLCIALSLIAIHSMFDPQMLVPWYSPFCLLLGQPFSVNVNDTMFFKEKKLSKGRNYNYE